MKYTWGVILPLRILNLSLLFSYIDSKAKRGIRLFYFLKLKLLLLDTDYWRFQTGLDNLQPVGQIWSTACFCMAWELRIIFLHFKWWGEKTKHHHRWPWIPCPYYSREFKASMLHFSFCTLSSLVRNTHSSCRFCNSLFYCNVFFFFWYSHLFSQSLFFNLDNYKG